MSFRIWLIGLAPTGLAALPGCTHAVLNQPLTRYQPTGGFRYVPRSSAAGSSDVAVMPFFSGGGKRAAAFAYRPPDYYLVNVDFESLPDAKDRGFFENLATSYVLSDKTVDRLIAAGGDLLEKSPEFQRLLHDLRGRPP
jgi:hypothetical protein